MDHVFLLVLQVSQEFETNAKDVNLHVLSAQAQLHYAQTVWTVSLSSETPGNATRVQHAITVKSKTKTEDARESVDKTYSS